MPDKPWRKYRKRPVVIEAYLNTGDAQWIKTLEGSMKAEQGDWIIRSIKGELYPCKDDIFRATYEEVADA